MRINILCNEVAGGWEPTDTRLGGTEKAVVEWAEELVKRGHAVTVFYNRRTSDKGVYKNFDTGVIYAPREHYELAKHDKNSFWDSHYADICINIKSSEIAPLEPTVYYTNETNASELDLSKYDAVVHISEWAKDNIPVNNPDVFIVPHGYDPEKIKRGQKTEKQCLYASSPDRGLDTLIKVWPEVHSKHPDATLIVTYGVTDIDLPGVTALGDVDEETMNHLYETSDIWCHPCNGGELFCITGIKAQAAGCVPVIIPRMALAETVKEGYLAKDEGEYAQTLRKALDEPWKRGVIRDKLAHHDYPTIEDSTNKLLDVIQFVLDKRK